jgi:hypothetical protein
VLELPVDRPGHRPVGDRPDAEEPHLRGGEGDPELLLGLAQAVQDRLPGGEVPCRGRVEHVGPRRLGARAALEQDVALLRDDPQVQAAVPEPLAVHVRAGAHAEADALLVEDVQELEVGHAGQARRRRGAAGPRAYP